MSSTPRPPSTACAAAAIWSGVGEVNTCPGQAASSIPWPTKPACRGSCPLPPPETNATLPFRGAARVTKAGFSWTERMSRWASARPRNASETTFTASLMNFFMAPSFSEASVDQLGHALDEIPDQGLQGPLLPRGAEHRDLQRQDLPAGYRPFLARHAVRRARRMGEAVSLEERLPLLGREMTDLEDGRQVPRGDGHRVDGIGELRDEALVLAELAGDPRPHAGRAPIDVVLQDRLVARDRSQLRQFDVAAGRRPSGHGPRPHACLASGTPAPPRGW